MDNLDSAGTPYLLAKVRSDHSNKNFKGSGTNQSINYHI